MSAGDARGAMEEPSELPAAHRGEGRRSQSHAVSWLQCGRVGSVPPGPARASFVCRPGWSKPSLDRAHGTGQARFRVVCRRCLVTIVDARVRTTHAIAEPKGDHVLLPARAAIIFTAQTHIVHVRCPARKAQRPGIRTPPRRVRPRGTYAANGVRARFRVGVLVHILSESRGPSAGRAELLSDPQERACGSSISGIPAPTDQEPAVPVPVPNHDPAGTARSVAARGRP